MVRSTHGLTALCPALLCLALAASPVGGQTPVQAIVVESPTMTPGEMMPRDYTPDGRNLSPPLTWSSLPDGTRELAVVCSDFGAGNPPPWVHWIIYGIPATAVGLPGGLPILPDTPMPPELRGAMQGLNGWRRPYYRGPAPPAGTPHLYHFTVYALDQALGLEPGLTGGSCCGRSRGTSSVRVISCRSTSGFRFPGGGGRTSARVGFAGRSPV